MLFRNQFLSTSPSIVSLGLSILAVLLHRAMQNRGFDNWLRWQRLSLDLNVEVTGVILELAPTLFKVCFISNPLSYLYEFRNRAFNLGWLHRDRVLKWSETFVLLMRIGILVQIIAHKGVVPGFDLFKRPIALSVNQLRVSIDLVKVRSTW